MIYAYVIEFPVPSKTPDLAQGPSVQVVSATEWEPSVHVYRYESWNRLYLHIATMGDSAHRSLITLPEIRQESFRFLFRIVHKTGTAVDELPWFASNNVLKYHGPQRYHDKKSRAYRPMLINVVGEDGNDGDDEEVMVYVSYSGPGWAKIKAVTERLEEGFLLPPPEITVAV